VPHMVCCVRQMADTHTDNQHSLRGKLFSTALYCQHPTHLPPMLYSHSSKEWCVGSRRRADLDLYHKDTTMIQTQAPPHLPYAACCRGVQFATKPALRQFGELLFNQLARPGPGKGTLSATHLLAFWQACSTWLPVCLCTCCSGSASCLLSQCTSAHCQSRSWQEHCGLPYRGLEMGCLKQWFSGTPASCGHGARSRSRPTARGAVAAQTQMGKTVITHRLGTQSAAYGSGHSL